MEQKFGVVAGNTYIRVDVRAQLLFLKLKLDLESVRIEEAAGLVRIGEAAGEPPVVAGREGIRHRVTECQLERKPKPVATKVRVAILGAFVPACCCMAWSGIHRPRGGREKRPSVLSELVLALISARSDAGETNRDKWRVHARGYHPRRGDWSLRPRAPSRPVPMNYASLAPSR